MKCINCGHKLVFSLENNKKELVHAYGGKVCEEVVDYTTMKKCGCSQPVAEEIIIPQETKQETNVNTARQVVKNVNNKKSAGKQYKSKVKRKSSV